MKKFVFLIFGLFALCESGSMLLPDKLKLEWISTVNNQIAFTFYVPNSIIENYCYVGIGIQETDQGGMDMADITIVKSEPENAEDYWCEETGMPDTDVSLGGTDDITHFDITYLGDFHVYTWAKDFDTGDDFDIDLVVDKDYHLLYAYGLCNEDGSFKKHADTDRGVYTITLSDDYDGSYETATTFLSIIK